MIVDVVTPSTVQPLAMTSPRTSRWQTVLVCAAAILLMAFSEFRFRVRSNVAAVSGSVDLAVMLELAAYAGVGAFLLLAVLPAPRLRQPTAVQFFFRAWVGLTALSCLWSPVRLFAVARAGQLIVIGLVSAALLTSARRRDFHMLSRWYVAMMAAAVLSGWWWHIPVSRLQADRFSFMAVHPVAAGSMLAVAGVIGFGYVFQFIDYHWTPGLIGNWSRGAYLVATLICWGGLIATRTRGAILAAVAGVVVIWILALRRQNRPPAVALAACVAAVGALLGSESAVKFVLRGQSAEALSTLNNRFPLWEAAISRAGERPLTGWGLSSTRYIFLKEIGLGGAHNAPLNVLVETGAIGLALWVGLLGAMALALLRLRRSSHGDVPMLAGLLTVLVVNSLTTEGLGAGYGAMALWLAVTVAWIGVDQRKVVAVPPHRPVRYGRTAPVAAEAPVTSDVSTEPFG